MLTFSWCAFRGRELLEVLVEGVVLDAGIGVLEDGFVVVVEPQQRVRRPALLVFLLEVRLFLRVSPVVGLAQKASTGEH